LTLTGPGPSAEDPFEETLSTFKEVDKLLEGGETKAFNAMKNIAIAWNSMGLSMKDMADRMAKMGETPEMIDKILDYVLRLRGGWKDLGDSIEGASKKASQAQRDLDIRSLRWMTSMLVNEKEKLKAHYAERLEEFNKHYDKRLETLKKRYHIESMESLRLQLERYTSAKEALERENELTDAKGKERNRILLDKYDKGIAEIKEKMSQLTRVINEAEAERTKLRTAAAGEYNRSLLDLEIDLANTRLKLRQTQEKKDLEIMRNKAIAEGKTQEEIKQKERELEVKQAEENLALVKENADKIIAYYKDEYHPKVKAAKQAVADAELKIERAKRKETTTIRKEEIKQEKRDLREMLDEVDKTSKEYLSLVTRAYDLHIISHREMVDRLKAAQGSLWENFKYGLEQAKTGVTTFNQVFQDLGKQIVGKVSDDLTGAFWDFADGTKTAKEAMKDFAESTIRWIGEMITKQLIFNSLMSLLPSGGMGGIGMLNASGYGVAQRHEGGIVGLTPAPVRIVNPNIFANAPRLHSGLRSDEFPAILQKGETVIPKGGGVTVNVINKSGVPLSAEQSEPQFDAGNIILDVVVDAMVRNKRGFRDNMKGMTR
jgi:hypothetical protein